MLRALHVVHQYPPAAGGCETVIQRISEGLAAEASIEVLTSASRALEFLYSESALPVGRAPVGGVMVERLAPAPLPRIARRGLYALAEGWARADLPGHGRLRALAVGPHLAGLVERGVRFRPRIVLAAPAPFLTLWKAERIARRTGAALALMPCLHADPQVDHPSLLRLLRRADAVLTMTDYEGRYLTSLGVARDRVHRVGGGVDPGAATAGDAIDPRGAVGLPRDAPIVLFAGRQGEGKGIEQLIEAMTRLWNAGSPAVLVVAGATTPRTATLRRSVERLDRGHRDRIAFRDDIGELEKWAWYRECAVMAAPSRVDSLGLCYLEAWLAGKPVVAARTGAQCELVGHDRDGLLVGPGDPGELAAALRALLDDPRRAEALGRSGRDRVLAEHTWSHVVGRVRKIYARLARGAI